LDTIADFLVDSGDGGGGFSSSPTIVVRSRADPP
jgi:hypothetical protein